MSLEHITRIDRKARKQIKEFVKNNPDAVISLPYVTSIAYQFVQHRIHNSVISNKLKQKVIKTQLYSDNYKGIRMYDK